MATGIEIYDAVKNEIPNRRREQDWKFAISNLDALDLLKLTTEDLCGRGYGESVAEKVCSAITNGNLNVLEETMGIKFDVRDDIPSLVGN
jgi:hypothetical protein